MRRLLFWMHLGAGVVASLFILFFSITGSLLAFERQIVNMADTRYGHAMPAVQSLAALPMDLLLARAAPHIAGSIETITLQPGRSEFVRLQNDNRDVYLVDPYSASVYGPASPRTRAFFAKVTALHRWFGAGEQHHARSIAVKGAATLLFGFLILSGAVLWLPARWTSFALRAGIVPRLHSHGRARNYNWHKVAGFWTALPLAVIILTGAVMAYPWANALLFRIAGTPVPVRASNANRSRHAGRPERGLLHSSPQQLEEAFANATNSVPGWKSATLRLQPDAPSLRFDVDRSEGGHPEQRVQVMVDPATVQVAQRTSFADQPRGQRWRNWVRFVHTGEAGGWWGETIALVATIGAIVLSVTGLLLSFHRLQRRTRKSRASHTEGALAGS